MTSYIINLLTIPGRDIPRPAQTREQRVAFLQRYLVEAARFAGGLAYQERVAELARLEAPCANE